MSPKEHNQSTVPNGTANNNNHQTLQPSPPPYFYFSSHTMTDHLIHYQYRGQDLSYLYKYLLSPLADVCVENWTPLWMAPNTITMIGLLFMISSYGVFWYHHPNVLVVVNDIDSNETTITEDSLLLPRWIFLWNALSILIYQTLDNMDGKQARKVGASSPLGLFFDHGCDALNSLFGSVNWIIAMQLSSSDLGLCFATLFGPYALFYIGTWEEYYTGQLIMPVMNGPNEGLMGAVIMSVLSYCYGPAYWQTTSWMDQLPSPLQLNLRNADVLVALSSIGFVQETTIKSISVVRRYGLRAALTLLPFATLTISSLLVPSEFWLDMPRTSLHLCAILFCEMTTELMLRHMTGSRFAWFRWILLPLYLFVVLIATDHWPSFITKQDYILMYTTMAGTYLTFKIVIVIHEMCCILDNIQCFRIRAKLD